MGPVIDPVDEILHAYGVPGPWVPLASTGVANRIYATAEIVLRIATDHPESVSDARTESVAAPVALAAGVLTPRLLAFDDTRRLTDRPFSLWERVPGEPLGLAQRHPATLPQIWAAVGRQLAILHSRVRSCPDPLGYLDTPGRDLTLVESLTAVASAGRLDSDMVRRTRHLVDELSPAVATPAVSHFLHNDIHEMNVLCGQDGSLVAVIDWGDAGWGDPTIEFAAIPLEVVPFVLHGYQSEAPAILGHTTKARIVWDKISAALEAAREGERTRFPLDQYRAFMETDLDLAAS